MNPPSSQIITGPGEGVYSMNFISRFVLLSALASTVSFAGVWSGTLVDSKCYASKKGNESGNVHPGSTDVNRPIRYCTPNAKTTDFAVVQHDGSVVDLDSAGNQKAMELVTKTKQSRYKVNVTGQMNQNVLAVDALSIAK
jgi:hypothetical protein